MSRLCHFTGKRTVAGRSIARRGKAKRLGGVGRKVTGISKRKFKPNIQRVRAIIDGKVYRIKGQPCFFLLKPSGKNSKYLQFKFLVIVFSNT